MVAKIFHETRKDGVRLFKHFDALVDEDGNFLKDEFDNYIPTGFKVQKVVVTWNGKRLPKEEYYDAPIDVEKAPYTYVETKIPVDKQGGAYV